MSSPKTHLFEPRLTAMAEMFNALSHPARLQILEYLAETKTCISGDISEEIPLSRSTVNQHLDELKKVGLIQGHTSGVKVNYCLNPEGINKLKAFITDFLNEVNYCYKTNC
ncbi:MAG: metalloregulator ArsR/SmtB family transcription factor [Bacteroidales bacterium]|nr:metalloregulator ArsR/SmtB family transcription factor [Bacteroidales bacterium]